MDFKIYVSFCILLALGYVYSNIGDIGSFFPNMSHKSDITWY
jgi:hypothetical protein